MIKNPHDEKLLALLEQSIVAKLKLEIDLSAADPHHAIIGYTTANSAMKWHSKSDAHHYLVCGLPVQIIESNEETVLLTIRKNMKPHGLWFVVHTRCLAEVVRHRNLEQVRLCKLTFDVQRFEQGAAGYVGTIASSCVTYEPTRENLLEFF